MITTVGKAREMWCPMDRGQISPREHTTGNCLGPDCMMWRFWMPPPGISTETVKAAHGQRDTDKKGYCGLAGVH